MPGLEREGMRVTANTYGVLGGVEGDPEPIVMMVAHLCEYTENQWSVHF